MINDSPYGLAAAITSASAEHAMTLARAIRAGAVSVNDGLPHGPDAPHSAFRQSGHGHNGGAEALEDYLVTKVIGVPVRSAAPDR